MVRFIKFVMILAGSLFVMAVFRAIMKAIEKGVTDMTGGGTARQPASPASNANEPSPVTSGGELKKCVACGTYNSAANSVTRQRGSETLYFCSTECRARHAA